MNMRPAARVLGTKIACLVCGSARSRLFRKVRNMDPKTEGPFPWIAVSICKDCGLIYQNPCLSQVEMEAYYSENEDKVTAAASDQVTEAENKSRLDGLLAIRKPPATLLEVGCSDGTFIDLARRAGFKVSGMDPSKENCRKARLRHPEISVKQFFLKDYPQGETFDVVCHFFVLEHTFEPPVFLEQCRRLLKPGGLLYFEIPNVDSFVKLPFANNLFIYQHISHFSPKTVRSLLERNGFRLLGVDGKMGKSPKSYGMRVAAVCEPAKAKPRSVYPASVKTLERYFGRRDGLVAKIDSRARRWVGKLKRQGPIVIFGAGENGRILNATSLRRCGRPLYFSDNNARLQGRVVDGLKVLKPAEVPSVKPALVIAASIDYQSDMERQLLGLGIDGERIVKLYENF
jgi:SAM-dependent methyltransferase